ncbi:MAG: DUF433 domain-containing protein [Bacteroidetes bacterium]|nr:DUF433 domain-containing protein [Bacteroidota bacterium]
MPADTLIKPRLGEGIYSIPEAAKILSLPLYKVRRLLKVYWNERFGKGKTMYSWGEGGAAAFNFLTLIEFYVFYQLKDEGVNTKDIISAHERLAHHLKTNFPFASITLLTDGGKILFETEGGAIVDIDPAFQFNMKEIIEPFCKKIEFNGQRIAKRFYPLGKEKSIVVDPHHQFGQPTIIGTNILPATIFSYYKGGEPVEFISSIFDLSKKQVSDALEYCKIAA